MSRSPDVRPAPAMDETTGLLDQQKHLIKLQESQTLASPKPSPFKWRAVTAFTLALICCACSNSITLFPMFAPGFQHSLGYSSFQVNTISIASSLGMYLPFPILGLVADNFGPGYLGILSIFLFSPSYYIAAVISRLSPEDASQHFHLLTAAFACIGTATSALYFSGVITCAKMMPKSPGMAISAPVACFGLSSLWQSQVLQSFFFDSNEELLLSPTFNFFAILYLVAGLTSYLGSTVIGRVTGNKQTSHDLPSAEPAPASDSNLKAPIGEPDDNTYESLGESPDDMLYKRHENVFQFLKDHTVWMLFIAFVLTSGPLEMYLNNMGTILSTISHGPSVTTNVSLFSAFSTVSRLSMGIFSDLLKDRVSRPIILVTILLLTALINILLASGVFTVLESGKYFFLSSSGIGFCYGAVYTLTPTIVACTWGVENLGTHWGIFITAPALGSTAFGLLFASVYDSASSAVSNLVSAAANAEIATCTGRTCYEFTFITSSISVSISAMIIAMLWLFAWKPRRSLV